MGMISENSKFKSRFAAIDDANVEGQRLPYLLEGQYVVEIDVIKTIDGRNDKLYYCTEFTIIESTNEQRPAGMRCSWLTDMGKDMGPINAKRFIGAVAGYTTTEEMNANVTGEVCLLAASEENPCKGCRVHVQVTMVKTKTEKKDFSEHRWTTMAGYSWLERNS
jgi:hypothetical protein